MVGSHEWFIVGAAGQLGQAVQKELLHRGISFLAFSSKQLDVREYIRVEQHILHFKPKVILNCAGWTDVPGAESNEDLANVLNAYSVENLAKAGRQIGAVLVQISSDYVFSGDKGRPYIETDHVSPQNAYGRSKALGEQLLSKIVDSETYIFRTAWLYSEFGRNFVKTILGKYLSQQNPLMVVNDQYGNPTSARDLAFQIVEAVLAKIPFGIYHAVNTNCTSWFDLTKSSLNFLGLDTANLVGISSTQFESKVKRPQYSCLDTFKWSLTKVPEMRNWKVALGDTIEKIYLEVEREVKDDFRKNGN